MAEIINIKDMRNRQEAEALPTAQIRGIHIGSNIFGQIVMSQFGVAGDGRQYLILANGDIEDFIQRLREVSKG